MQSVVLPLSLLLPFLEEQLEKNPDQLVQVLTDEETNTFLISLTSPMDEAIANVAPTAQKPYKLPDCIAN